MAVERSTMTNSAIYILAVAVALLAALCFWQCNIIKYKDDRLAKLADEISEQKDTILELELELQRNSETIRALNDKQTNDSDSGL